MLVRRNGKSFLFPYANGLLSTVIQLRIILISPKILPYILDVDPYFTTIPLDYTLVVRVQELLKIIQTVSNLTKQQVLKLLLFITKENMLLDQNKL